MSSSVEQLVIVIGVGTLMFLLFSSSIIIFLLLQKRKYVNYIQEKTALKAAYEKDILQAQIEIQDQTKQQISRELHDNIGQILSVARLNLSVLEEEGNIEVAHLYAQNTNELIKKAIGDIRTLSKSLDGDFVKDFGLEQSLSEELQCIRKTGVFQTEMEVTGKRFGLGFQTEIILFRICQEVLNNALKHSEASKLKIILNYETTKLVLSIWDNGKGFDYEQVMNSQLSASGAGLRNIKRRAELLSGSCTIDSSIGKGTKITINCPIGGQSAV